MINPCCFIGEPLIYNKFKIYPPTIKDVVSNPMYGKCLKVLTLSQEEIEDDFVESKNEIDNVPSPFDFLLANSYKSKEYEAIVKEAFEIFFHQKIEILYDIKVILFGELEDILKDIKDINELTLIKEDNFFELQNLVREAVGLKKIEPPNPKEDPRVKRIKAKARYRDKIKAKQGKGLNMLTSLAALCCMGIGLTPMNIGQMSYAAVSPLIQMCQNKEKYTNDINILVHSTKSKIKPEYWIKNFND